MFKRETKSEDRKLLKNYKLKKKLKG